MFKQCVGGALATLTLIVLLFGPLAAAIHAADDVPRTGVNCLEPVAQQTMACENG